MSRKKQRSCCFRRICQKPSKRTVLLQKMSVMWCVPRRRTVNQSTTIFRGITTLGIYTHLSLHCPVRRLSFRLWFLRVLSFCHETNVPPGAELIGWNRKRGQSQRGARGEKRDETVAENELLQPSYATTDAQSNSGIRATKHKMQWPHLVLLVLLVLTNKRQGNALRVSPSTGNKTKWQGARDRKRQGEAVGFLSS